MLADSGLLRDLEQHAFSTTRQPMALYGDPAYPLRVHLQVPYRGAGITPQMGVYNKAMSAVRMSVEWLFGDIVNYFKFLDFKKNLKVSLSAVGKMYIVCAILRNALTCMYSNLTSEYFAVDPPTIQDYFAWTITMVCLQNINPFKNFINVNTNCRPFDNNTWHCFEV